jgi:hypothetical protein
MHISSQASVAHACKPSYLGGRDQEDKGSKPARANSSRDPISKISNTHKKRVGGVAQGAGPEFKPQYHKKKKKRFSINTVGKLKLTVASLSSQ